MQKKNCRYWLIPSTDIVDLQFGWTRAFWVITCKTEFFHISGLHIKTENCVVFNFRLFTTKSNDNLFGKNPVNPILGSSWFWAFQLHFWNDKIFSGNYISVHFFSFSTFLSRWKIQKKSTDDQDVRTDNNEIIRPLSLGVQWK